MLKRLENFETGLFDIYNLTFTVMNRITSNRDLQNLRIQML